MSYTCLNNLDNNSNSSKTKRVGRGIGSGKGKTCGRGHKGQKSRSGVSINGFEGGQTPIFRRIPKRGFNSLKKKSYQVVTLSTISSLLNKYPEISLINNESLFAKGAIKKSTFPVKIVGNSFTHTKLKFNVDHYSNGAKTILASNDCDLQSAS